MEGSSQSIKFIETDDNRYVDLDRIVWMKKLADCYYICSKANGCVTDEKYMYANVGKVCEFNNKKTYDFINKYIKEKTI